MDGMVIFSHSVAAQNHAIELSKKYDLGKSRVADLLTIATAIELDFPVFTLNFKDYQRIKEVEIHVPSNWEACKKELN